MRTLVLSRSISAALVLFPASFAGGQTFVRPHVYMWQVEVPPGVVQDTHTTPMIRIDVDGVQGYYADPCNPATLVYTPVADPGAMALATAKVVKQRICEGSVTPSTVCVFPKNFGSHANNTGAPGQLSFFIRGSAVDDAQNPGDELPGNMQFPNANPATNKKWLHPFLRNALRRDGLAHSAPLRDWALAYAAALEPARMAEGLSSPGDAANPWRFYLDNEELLTDGDENGLYTLHYIATKSGNNGFPRIWQDWKVPGSPGWTPQPGFTAAEGATGMSLSEMYTAVYQQNGWPANIADPIVGIDLLATEGVAHARNRGVMIWWGTICARAEDAVLRNCLVDAIHFMPDGVTPRWPGANCGNYDDFSTDGLPDTTGWFRDMDDPSPGGLEPGHPMQCGQTPQVYPLNNIFPRTVMVRGSSITLMERANQHDRYYATSPRASGDVDSPELYPLRQGGPRNMAQLDGFPTGLGRQRGHRQLNPYVPSSLQYPDAVAGCVDTRADQESQIFNSLRVQRHLVESIINSNGGGHEDRLCPWVPQLLMNNDIATPDSFHLTDRSWRAQLAMLRAKNPREFLAWMRDPLPTEDPIIYKWGWEATQSTLNRVYAARIHSGPRWLWGDAIGPPSQPVDPASLEFTLRVNGLDNTADRHAAPDPQHRPGMFGTQLFVKVDGLYPYRMTTTSAWSFEINVECSAWSSAVGRLYAYDFGTGHWSLVPLMEREYAGGDDSTLAYGFHTPDGTTRRTFVLRVQPPHQFIRSLAAGEGHMWLKLEHRSSAVAGLPTSKYDLVQVVPIDFYGGGSLMDPVPVLEPDGLYDNIVDDPSTMPYAYASAVWSPALDPAWGADACLNSAFGQLPPDCQPGDPCYSARELRLTFTGPVRAAEGVWPPVFVRKVGGDPTFNYASLMDIAIQRVTDTGYSRQIALRGDGVTLLVEGEYEILPITSAGGQVLSPLSDSLSPSDAEPVTPFAFTFTLLSDCNRNGNVDFDDVTNTGDIQLDPILDIWPLDGLIDDCHPELCEPDYTQDGFADQDDVDCLIAVLAGNPACAPSQYTDPDFNGDGLVDQGDVDALINTVAGNGCP